MTESSSLYDLSAFREMDAEDPGALATIVGVFLDTTPGVVEELNKAYGQGDMPALASLAHKLKATIDILNIKDLTGLIRQVESIAKTGENAGSLPEMINTINTTLELVFSKIKEEIS